jgi:hypothetical protein
MAPALPTPPAHRPPIMIMSPATTRDQISTWKHSFEGRVVISFAFGTEEGEVFYGLTDWLGSRDPLTPYDTCMAHRYGLDD